MPKYLPKMHEIEAYCLRGLQSWNYPHYPDWVKNMLNTDEIIESRKYVHINTCEGIKTVDYSGYILKDERGLIYAMDEDEFLDKYEIVREGGKNG